MTILISIHALREESDLIIYPIHRYIFVDFNPRSPWGERPFKINLQIYFARISIHALREESDGAGLKHYTDSQKFQSTLSVRRATHTILLCKISSSISIHALREESDTSFIYARYVWNHFNPRSPWGERRTNTVKTPLEMFISIHALREESDKIISAIKVLLTPISIHALREESDPWNKKAVVDRAWFQSTLSVRRATSKKDNKYDLASISIHALREESDPEAAKTVDIKLIFQSTLSVRRATKNLGRIMAGQLRISIHALREESDNIGWYFNDMWHYFNPRSPWGERRVGFIIVWDRYKISIHALREESDKIRLTLSLGKWGFQSTLSVRRATHSKNCLRL